MSTERKMKGAHSQAQPLGPDGEKLCRWCRLEVKPPRRTFCSPECVHEWRLRTSTSYLRACVKKRDKEICANCKLDCKKLRIKLRHLYKENKKTWKLEVEKLGIPKGRYHKSLWDADHLVPVCEGGGLCGLEGLRSLCWACHRIETNKLLKKRRIAKKEKLNASKK